MFTGTTMIDSQLKSRRYRSVMLTFMLFKLTFMFTYHVWLMSMFHCSIPFHFIEENGTRMEWEWNGTGTKTTTSFWMKCPCLFRWIHIWVKDKKSAGEGIWTPVYRYDNDWHLVKIHEKWNNFLFPCCLFHVLYCILLVCLHSIFFYVLSFCLTLKCYYKVVALLQDCFRRLL
jgi:hypothetical protein